MLYKDFKDLPSRTASDKILRDKAFNIVNNPKHDKYQLRFASVLHKFFDKNYSFGIVTHTDKSAMKSEAMPNH